ncbi:MAG: nucleoside triphosphate pyrophosphohydrolase [Candidatus Eisenbacteria bacterium]|nr:nucleoside triphosphate pyrophosphohydrolase [Candidatus Eisenbacteria bacterium]
MTDSERIAFESLLGVCRRLRGPDGCPWDREQTLETMTPYLTEEAVEAVEAITSGDAEHAAEELGDLGFLVLFCLELLGERSGLGVGPSFERATEKLIRRHPHVYGDAVVNDGEQAYKQWQEIKKAEKSRSDAPPSLLGDQPKGLPALVAAWRLQEKAAAVGFDWPDLKGPVAKIHEEVAEIEHALGENAGQPSPEVAREIGDLLFAVVNLARKLRIDPEAELRGTSKRFRSRFLHIEKRLAESGRTPSQSNLEEMDAFWEEAKRLSRSETPDASPPTETPS